MSQLQAADVAMITHGWTWRESAWAIAQEADEREAGRRGSSGGGGQGAGAAGMSSDGEGWSYATNFGSIEESGTAVKGMTHFVRRRRRTRQQVFLGAFPAWLPVCLLGCALP